MTEKRFTHKEDDWEILDRNKHFAYAHSGCQAEKIIQELNELVETNKELYKENKQLKQFKEQHIEEYLKLKTVSNELKRENEQLKTIRSDLICELDIVQNELNIAIDEGFAPSKSYKNYMASKKTEYDKFWENKIKTHNNRLKGDVE